MEIGEVRIRILVPFIQYSTSNMTGTRLLIGVEARCPHSARKLSFLAGKNVVGIIDTKKARAGLYLTMMP